MGELKGRDVHVAFRLGPRLNQNLHIETPTSPRFSGELVAALSNLPESCDSHIRMSD